MEPHALSLSTIAITPTRAHKLMEGLLKTAKPPGLAHNAPSA